MKYAALRRWWPFGGLALSFALWWLRKPLVSVAAAWLPGRAQVSSRGTAFESFPEITPDIIGRLSPLIAVSSVAGLIAPHVGDRSGQSPLIIRKHSDALSAINLVSRLMPNRKNSSFEFYRVLGDLRQALRIRNR